MKLLDGEAWRREREKCSPSVDYTSICKYINFFIKIENIIVSIDGS
jgi:hypothetical protein